MSKQIEKEAVLPQPEAYLFQHDETGQTMFVEAQQVEWGFEANNPRLHKICGVFTEPQVRALLPSWQPIESAPKDGTCIILGREGDEDREAISVPGFWIEGMGDMPDEMGHDAGFTDVNFQTFCPGRSWGVERYRYPAFQPTRWMPLPAPPSQEGAA